MSAMSTETREDRALARGAALAGRITRVAKGVYHCPSQSDPEGFHIVSDLGVLGVGQGLACTCPASEHGAPVCAHRAALVVARQDAERRKLSLRPVVTRHPRKEVRLV